VCVFILRLFHGPYSSQSPILLSSRGSMAHQRLHGPVTQYGPSTITRSSDIWPSCTASSPCIVADPVTRSLFSLPSSCQPVKCAGRCPRCRRCLRRAPSHRSPRCRQFLPRPACRRCRRHPQRPCSRRPRCHLCQRCPRLPYRATDATHAQSDTAADAVLVGATSFCVM
jgi:hypothetical protein